MDSVQSDDNEACQMSWFLIEVKTDETNSTENCIVNKGDITDSSTMYANRIVKFNHNQRNMEGELILAADDRCLIEQEMERRTNATEPNKNKGTLYCVQYYIDSKTVVHAILSAEEVYHTTGDEQNPGEVFVRNAQNLYHAMVLFMNEDEKKMQEEFEALKDWCEKKFLQIDPDTDTDVENWMMVQYAKNPQELVYAIVNKDETHWEEYNPHPNVVTYLNIEEKMYQAVVLDKSQDLESLLEKFKMFKDCHCHEDCAYHLQMEAD